MSVANRGKFFAQRGAQMKDMIAGYIRPPPKTYTEACEAPPAMWEGAIPLKRRYTGVPGSQPVLEKTYNHPNEVNEGTALNLNNVNAMYCMGNDTLVDTFPEGLGGKVMQLFPPSHPRGWLYRKQSHLLNVLIEKFRVYNRKKDTISQLCAGRPGLIVDGATGVGKSALMCQAVHYARSRGILTVYVPNAKDWTHGEWCWPSTILPGFFDVPDASRNFLQYFARSHQKILSEMKLAVTPELPVEGSEVAPKTVYDLCVWGYAAPAPSSIDRQSVAIKFLMDELRNEKSRPILFVVDGMNLFSHETHFRYPHPDFLRSMGQLGQDTDMDLYPQEFPRIPGSRLTFVRSLNKMMLEPDDNKLFLTSTTRDFKPFDGGVSGFENPMNDKHPGALDEYAPYHPEKDSVLHPMQLGNFDEFEYRSFLRFLVNSGELAGFGWGPLWHYSSSFERKLYKIEFMSERNPQRVVEHYHQEITWLWEYQRIRQKQYLTERSNRRRSV